MSEPESDTGYVAQWLSTRFSRRRPGYDITARPALEALRITEEKMMPLSLHLQMIMVLLIMVLMVFKDYKPEVLSHNSLESHRCGTLKYPHTICKE